MEYFKKQMDQVLMIQLIIRQCLNDDFVTEPTLPVWEII